MERLRPPTGGVGYDPTDQAQVPEWMASSDITITLGGLKPFKGWPMTVTNSRDGSPLWSGAQKRGITNRVPTDLVKKLRKLLEDKKK